MAEEKVLITGATGRIGQMVVRGCLAKGVSTTVFVRNLEKSRDMFGEHALLTHVHGDLKDVDAFTAAVRGHTRVFILSTELLALADIKEQLARAAYGSGVQQIVDMSSRLVTMPWRTSVIGEAHRLAEEKMYAVALEKKAHFVAVRPSRFMSNQLFLDAPAIKSKGAIIDHYAGDAPNEWISPNDIADVITTILTDPVANHANFAYQLIGDSISGNERAKLFSRALGKTITYQATNPKDQFDLLTSRGHPAPLAFDICALALNDPPTNVVPILLGRPNETMEQWINKNKQHFAD